jgi:hypothetical protein
MRVTNDFPLGCSLLLPGDTVNCVQTLKAFLELSTCNTQLMESFQAHRTHQRRRRRSGTRSDEWVTIPALLSGTVIRVFNMGSIVLVLKGCG